MIIGESQILPRDPGSYQGTRFSSGIQVLPRDPASHQGTRFSPGNKILTREPRSHQGIKSTRESCSENCFDVLKALIIPTLHSNLHLKEPNSSHYLLPPFSNVCPLTAGLFFFKGESKHTFQHLMYSTKLVYFIKRFPASLQRGTLPDAFKHFFIVEYLVSDRNTLSQRSLELKPPELSQRQGDKCS